MKKKWWTSWWFQTNPPKTNVEPENIQILEKDGKGETSTKQLLFWGSMCLLSRVSFLFSPPTFGEMIQFHEDGFYKWVESQPPTIVKILLEIRMRILASLFFKGPSTKVFKNSEKEDKKDTINWTWNKGEDFEMKMDVSHGNIYVALKWGQKSSKV